MLLLIWRACEQFLAIPNERFDDNSCVLKLDTWEQCLPNISESTGEKTELRPLKTGTDMPASQRLRKDVDGTWSSTIGRTKSISALASGLSKTQTLKSSEPGSSSRTLLNQESSSDSHAKSAETKSLKDITGTIADHSTFTGSVKLTTLTNTEHGIKLPKNYIDDR